MFAAAHLCGYLFAATYPVRIVNTMTRSKSNTDEATDVEATDVEVAGASPEATVATATTSENKQGRAIILPSGERRIDYIKRRYYGEGATRSVIAKELTELTGKVVPYQIVFAGTKEAREEAPVEGAEAVEDATAT